MIDFGEIFLEGVKAGIVFALNEPIKATQALQLTSLSDFADIMKIDGDTPIAQTREILEKRYSK